MAELRWVSWLRQRRPTPKLKSCADDGHRSYQGSHGAEIHCCQKNVTLPAELDSSHKSTLENLRTKVGPDFDKAYVDDMVSDHEKAVSEFQSRAKNASDPDVKVFAEKTLPTLQKHLDAIKAIQAKMK